MCGAKWVADLSGVSYISNHSAILKAIIAAETTIILNVNCNGNK